MHKVFFPFLPPVHYLGLTFVSDLLYFVALVSRGSLFHVIRISRPAVNEEHRQRTRFCRGDESLGLKIRASMLPLKGGDRCRKEIPQLDFLCVLPTSQFGYYSQLALKGTQLASSGSS